MKKFGFGTMRFPLLNAEDQASVDVPQVKKMVDYFMDHGYTYFDTAWMYHDHKSEAFCKEVLVDRYPRESFRLATKFPVWEMKELNTEERDKIFAKQLENTGVSYFDYYLIHCVDHTNVEKCDQVDLWNWLIGLKEQGLAKHIGFSFHDTAELLEKVLTAHPEVEFVQLQLNYLDWEDKDVQARLCYETCVRHGKKVIVMEPVRGGQLAQNVPAAAARAMKDADPDASYASWAVRFAVSLPEVMMVLSGMSSYEQMLDNVKTFDEMNPLTEAEMNFCLKLAEEFRKSILISCTACNYCGKGCPQEIPIYRYFRMYNIDAQPEKNETFIDQKPFYDKLAAKKAKASDCLECGQCEDVCPQHLPIIELLKQVTEHFE